MTIILKDFNIVCLYSFFSNVLCIFAHDKIESYELWMLKQS